MRRTVLYAAGLMMATGTGLMLAGPASAAPRHDSFCCHSDRGFEQRGGGHEFGSRGGQGFQSRGSGFRDAGLGSRGSSLGSRGSGLGSRGSGLGSLGQISLTNIIVLNNVGSPQIGIGGGTNTSTNTVNLSSYTSQLGGVFGR